MVNPYRKKYIGQRMADRREELGFSQQLVTNRLNAAGLPIERSAYAHFEAGTNEPAATMLEEIAKVLKTRIGYFFGEDAEHDILDEETHEIREAYKRLPPEFKAGIRAMILAGDHAVREKRQ